jgi:hypothetical protein
MRWVNMASPYAPLYITTVVTSTKLVCEADIHDATGMLVAN